MQGVVPREIKAGGPKFVAVIAFVGDQHRCRWQRIKHQLGAFVIVHLAFGEQKDQGTAVFVDDGMEFGGSGRLSCVRYGGEHPLFKQARRRAVRLEMRGIDHQLFRCSAFACKGGEDAVENA